MLKRRICNAADVHSSGYPAGQTEPSQSKASAHTRCYSNAHACVARVQVDNHKQGALCGRAATLSSMPRWHPQPSEPLQRPSFESLEDTRGAPACSRKSHRVAHLPQPPIHTSELAFTADAKAGPSRTIQERNTSQATARKDSPAADAPHAVVSPSENAPAAEGSAADAVAVGLPSSNMPAEAASALDAHAADAPITESPAADAIADEADGAGAHVVEAPAADASAANVLAPKAPAAYGVCTATMTVKGAAGWEVHVSGLQVRDHAMVKHPNLRVVCA